MNPPLRPVLKLALSKQEAAEALSVSEEFLDARVRPCIRIVRQGRRLLFPVRELERWLDENASRVADDLGG